MVKAEDILAGLSDEQLAVATTFGAPIAVLAGAGTGKTRAITHRIAYAVTTGRQQAEANLAVTFTNRAAGQLRARLAALGVAQVAARTFHAAALRQLRFFWPKAEGTELPKVVAQTLPIVAAAADQLGIDDDISLLRDLGTEISWAKVSNVSPARYEGLAVSLSRAVPGLTSEQVSQVFAGYEAIKRRSGVIDFDDILLCAVAMLHEHPEIAEQIRDGYRYITVDEYQDVSPLQHTLLELWTDGRSDLCVVGDPNQSIHAFAGADRTLLINFEKLHPGAKVLTLTKNFRSTPQVLAAANALLANDKSSGMHHRPLQSVKPDGAQVTVASAKDEGAEARQCADWLVDMHEAGLEWRELALLYRINAQSRPFEEALSQLHIPYRVKDADNFYQRPEIRQALAALNKLMLSGETCEAIEGVQMVVANLGWAENPPPGSGTQRARWESLNALLDFSRELVESGHLDFPALTKTLLAKADDYEIPRANAVILASLHSAKGLEWDGVALVGLSEGIVPISLAKTPTELAEERRLLYVGLTRAKKYLRLSWPADKKPSRFLKALSQDVATTKTEPITKHVARCFICGRGLTGGDEITLGRHASCSVQLDETLFDKLKHWRAARASEENLPPFVIISDKTLQAISERKPANTDELSALSGLGKEKMARYGDELLAVINT